MTPPAAQRTMPSRTSGSAKDARDLSCSPRACSTVFTAHTRAGQSPNSVQVSLARATDTLAGTACASSDRSRPQNMNVWCYTQHMHAHTLNMMPAIVVPVFVGAGGATPFFDRCSLRRQRSN